MRTGLIAAGQAAAFAGKVIQSFDVRTTGPAAEARSLSGGNLQKFIVGREILQAPGVLVISQPTWGVDAGAAAAIYQALLDLADAGTAVLIISQDLDEIFSICDRIAVIYQGTLSEARPIRDVTVEEIGLLMGGAHPEDRHGNRAMLIRLEPRGRRSLAVGLRLAAAGARPHADHGRGDLRDARQGPARVALHILHLAAGQHERTGRNSSSRRRRWC